MKKGNDNVQQTLAADALLLHEKYHGKLCVQGKVPLKTRYDLSLAYTPGVAEVCRLIAEHPEAAFSHSLKANSVAVVSDGSSVLGLGNIGPLASIPVMEGKALLFKEFANIDAFPICVDTRFCSVVDMVKAIAPVFGGINLEDIKAPECFLVEQALQDLGIPVMHDDQHGTAVVVLAALLNAAKVVKKDISQLKVVINGAGAAGSAVAKLLRCVGHPDRKVCIPVKEVMVCDSKGIISPSRSDLNVFKQELLVYTNPFKKEGTLPDALLGADVFIGVSRGNLLKKEDIKGMQKQSIIFAMANPIPEIMPDEAYAGGAAVVGTGRSDLPNQINNVLGFPGIFRGALDTKATKITETMKIAAAHALATAVTKPTKDNVLPNPLDKSVVPRVAKAVADAARKEGCIRQK
ncbi:NADP-dependent malic enzyme [Candidatus Woesearchaeota archaeon]|nr:NADP-dependent malic enzyme [Candidatus Woesearchaeota archaeon]